MKKKSLLILSIILSCFVFKNTFTASLDGTINLVYTNLHNVFSDGESATGFVKMDNGFQIATDAEATINITEAVSGSVDLNTTGVMVLDGDLYLDSNVVLANGGYIYGNGHTIFLGGDLTIPDESDLRFTNSTIIDGQGHDLILGHRAQLLIETVTTLTLRNLTLKNSLNTISQPAVKCLDWQGKLALDNVELALNDDFSFYSGQLFIHNDVILTGTSEFIYRGVRPSYITEHATLNFDKGTSFDYCPSCTDETLIRMNSETSLLYFDGCTLKTTITGLQLTTGSVYFDNKVNVTSASELDISGFTNDSNPIATSASYGGSIRSVQWSPDGNFVAVGGDTQTIQVFEFTGSSLNLVATSATYSYDIQSLSWSSDGRFIAIGGTTTVGIQVFEFTGSSLSLAATSAAIGNSVWDLSWSPSGRFIAVGGNNKTVQVFEFTGSSLNLIATSASYGDTIFALSWNPNGQFIAAGGGYGVDSIQIFEFDGSGFANSGNPIATSIDYGGAINSLSWNPDGRFIAAGGSTAHTVQIFEFNGSSFANSGNPIATSTSYGSAIRNLALSPNGRFISVGGDSTQTAQIFEFNGSDFVNSGNPIATTTPYGGQIFGAPWSPDGRFIAIGGISPFTVQVFEPSLRGSSTTQAISNSIVFQDLVNGVEPDASIYLLGAAEIILDGIMHL